MATKADQDFLSTVRLDGKMIVIREIEVSLRMNGQTPIIRITTGKDRSGARLKELLRIEPMN